MACTACGQCMGIASSGDGERNAVRVHARCVSGRPADDQPVASDFKHTSCFLTCKRGLQCESTCVAGEARTRAACVTSVLRTRVLVWKAQGSECERGGGEAEAGKPVRDILEIGKSGNREIGKRVARIRLFT